MNDKFLEKNPHLSEFLPFLSQLNNESHRGAVLTACSYIEELLRRIILSYLLDKTESNKLLEGFNAPLSSLSARTRMAYTLGLIYKKEFEEIKILRKIRNIFAHDFKVSFSDQAIKKLCDNLTYSARNPQEPSSDSFSEFNTSAVALILNFINRDYYVSLNKVIEREWPY